MEPKGVAPRHTPPKNDAGINTFHNFFFTAFDTFSLPQIVMATRVRLQISGAVHSV